jgi:VanZ family protein
MKNAFRYQMPLLLWAIVIFWLSSIKHIPSVKLPILPADKVVHFCIFFVFCWFSRRAFWFQDRHGWLKEYSLILAFVTTAFYGYSDELHQLFVPDRTYDYFDWLADSSGALFFVLLFLVTKPWRIKRAQYVPIPEV